VGLCIAACGCSAGAGGARSGVYQTPGAAWVGAHEPTTSELAQAADARAAALSTFRGQARLSYEDDHDKLRSSQMIVVKGAASVRIDIMGPFGPTYTVASDGAELTAYDRGEKILYSGTASVEHVERYTRVALEVPVLAALVRGMPPALPYEEGVVSRRHDGWEWHRELEGGGEVSVIYDFKHTEPIAFRISGSATRAGVQATFGDYQDVDGVRTPHLVEVTFANGAKAKLEYERIWRNISISDRAFQIQAAAGVRRVEMDRHG
jgi:hypothetical protein